MRLETEMARRTEQRYSAEEYEHEWKLNAFMLTLGVLAIAGAAIALFSLDDFSARIAYGFVLPVSVVAIYNGIKWLLRSALWFRSNTRPRASMQP